MAWSGTHGFEEGHVCMRLLEHGTERCKGIILLEEPENCSCHVSAPCGPCTNVEYYCPECDWSEGDT